MTLDDISTFGTLILNKKYWIDYFNKNIPYVMRVEGYSHKIDPIAQIEEIECAGSYHIFYMIKRNPPVFFCDVDYITEYSIESKEIEVEEL